MPNKTEEYLALACKTADSFSRQWEHWAEFLITAARLYKYSYPDQLMIYAQRPDATAFFCLLHKSSLVRYTICKGRETPCADGLF